jgi:hypothetical protein
MVLPDPVFTLLDNQPQSFEIPFIDQSGTNFCAGMRWFFADILERCENRKYSGTSEKTDF